MASAAFLALLEQPAVAGRLLVNLQVRQALHGWTSEGSGAYSCPYDLYTHPTTIRADRGLYRGLDAAWEGTTALTVRASVASVKASGGYYHDGTTLYVKTSGAVNPDTLAMLQAVGTLRVATSPVCFTDQPPYDAQVDGQSLPSIVAARPDLLRGASIYPFGDLTLTNADGLWDYLTAPEPAVGWQWQNNTVEIRLGGDSLVYTDYELLATMQVAEVPAAGVLMTTVQLRSMSAATVRAFPQHTLSDFYGPTVGGGGGVPSAYMPVWWGRVIDAPLLFMFSEYTPGDNKWIAGDPFLVSGVTVESVAAIAADGTRTTLVDGVDYTYLGGGDTAFTILATYDPAAYVIVATMSRSPSTAGAIALAVLQACGVPDAQIDLATFTQLDVDAPAPLGLWAGLRPGAEAVSALIAGTDLLNQIERAGPASIVYDGLWRATRWDPSFDLATTRVLTDADLRTCAVVTEAAAKSTSVKAQYARRIAGDTWLETSSTSAEAEAAQQDSSGLAVPTPLGQAADAGMLAGRLAAVDRLPTLRYQITTGPVLLHARIGDKVCLRRSRGASSTGTFDQILEIESLTKQLATLTVDARVGNQRGLGERVKRAAPDGTPAWASASAEERRQYAFVADTTTEMVDPTDRATYRQAVAW